MPSLQRETNLDTPFWNMLFCTNLLDPVCSLEQKALRPYHPIRTEYNLWIHSRSSSSPWFEPLLIIAKYYIYTASRREEDYIWEAFFAILKSHLEIEKHKSKSQISIWASFCLAICLVIFIFFPLLYFFLFFYFSIAVSHK